jgi:hypothetical protein
MLRRVSVLGLAAALLTAAAGCRSQCGERHGLFTSSCGSPPSCRLIGSCKNGEGCCEGYPIQGVPVSGPGGPAPGVLVPGNGVPVLPGPYGPETRPDELPYPQPSGLIPPAGVPYAPPGPAPGDMGNNGGLPRNGQPVPVKNGK